MCRNLMCDDYTSKFSTNFSILHHQPGHFGSFLNAIEPRQNQKNAFVGIISLRSHICSIGLGFGNNPADLKLLGSDL